MSTAGLIIFTIVALLIAISILVWVFRFIAVIVMAFSGAMLSLPLVIMLLVFVLFPPTLIVFIVGWFALLYEANSTQKSTKKKWYERESEADYIKRQREKLGYDVEDEDD